MISVLIDLLALLPFILLLVLIVFKKWPALKAIPLTWLVTTMIVLIFWQLSWKWIVASFFKGTFIAFEIILIILGAIWILEILKERNQIKNLQGLLANVSNDARIQAIIIAWLFGALIEGVAGFGVPAALAAPLLVALGFTPLLAVTVSLIANSTPVSFGAAGLPILLGLGSLGFERSLLEEVAKTVAVFHSIAGFIIPLSIVFFVCSFKSKDKKQFKKYFFEAVPFAILAWFAFVAPYLLTTWFIGPELPSIVGGLVGMFIVILAAKKKFLVPKNVLRFNKKIKYKKSKKKLKLKDSLFGLSPYLLMVFLLTASRVIEPLKNKLIGVSFGVETILNLEISYSFSPFFTPSFYFFLTGLFCLFIFKANKKETKKTLSRTWKKVKLPLIALIFTLALVQLLIVSGNNNSNTAGIPLLLAQLAQSIFKQVYVIVAPFIGSFGSFIAGSNTVSNLLFGLFQSETAQALGFSVIVVLSLQVVGGAIGNMIAIHNVLAASATVGLQGQEGKIIRKTILVMIIYGVLVAFIGLLAIFLF